MVTATREFGTEEAGTAADAPSAPLSVETGDAPPPADGTPYAQGQLTVRLRLHPNAIDSSTSDLCARWSDTPPASRGYWLRLSLEAASVQPFGQRIAPPHPRHHQGSLSLSAGGPSIRG